MQEGLRHRHYSDKSGHKKRSVVNRLLTDANRKGVSLCKSELTFCIRRFARRAPQDGKR